MNIDFVSLLLSLIISLILFIWAKIFYKSYFTAIVIGFIVRICLIIINEQTFLFGTGDITDYLPYLDEFNQIGYAEFIENIKPHAPFYTVLYPGWIFNVTGGQGLWVIRVANAALGVAIIAPLSWLNKIIFKKKLTQSQVLLVMLWPSWLRYTIELGRTSPTVLMTILGIVGLLGVSSSVKLRFNPKIQIFTVLGIVFGCFLRTHYIAYFIPIVSFSLLSEIKKSKMPSYIRNFLYLISILIAVVIIIAMLNIYQRIGAYSTSTNLLDLQDEVLRLAESAENEGGRSNYLEGVYPSNPVDWVWYLPVQAIYFMFSPMLWDVHSGFALGSSIQALFLLFLCFRVWKKRKKYIIKSQEFKIILITIIFTSIAFGAGVKNAGSAERWRFPSTLILLTTTTSVLESVRKENKNIVSSINA